MKQTAHAICNLCEAECGILVEHDGTRVLSIRGNERDPLSRGHICPKGAALADLHHDPDRLRHPIKRVGKDTWTEVSWAEALDEIAERITDIQQRHGRNAVALYSGNPTVHSHSAVLYSIFLHKVLGTRQIYSSNSMDALPRLLTSYLMYGGQTLLPVPDVDRTDFWLIIGANPIVSGGSVMTAPGVKRRIRDLQRRGGQVVVIDPRRTETAAIADRHLFIRPSSDALLLAAMLQTIFAHGEAAPGRLAGIMTDIDRLAALVEPFTPERVEAATGIPAAAITELALDFASARAAVCYGRLGTCTQEFGTLASWLIDCLNIVTGNLDRPGGAMFSTPPVDLPGLAALLGQRGSFGTFRGSATDLPEFAGELPVTGLLDELAGDRPERIRALITIAGNPALSMPTGGRLDQALEGLEFMVSLDIYRNETTRHADFILPTTTNLERDHYPLVFSALSVRNTARYSPAVFEPSGNLRHDWQIISGLCERLLARRSLLARALAVPLKQVLKRGPDWVIDLGMRTGPHNLRLADLHEHKSGIDLGPLVARLPRLLHNKDKRIQLTPQPMVDDMPRLLAQLPEKQPERQPERQPANGDGTGAADLSLITRRDLRSNNTWMHNSQRLTRGKPRCVLHMHPDDASARGIADGDRVTVRSQVGALQVPVAVTEDMMPGVISMPFGWGHDRAGAALSVAAQHAGTSINEITDVARIDQLSGCISFALPVTVERTERA